MKRTVGCLVSLFVLSAMGCGTVVTADYPNRLVGADGQRFTVDDLEAISQDPNLDDDAKREEFRALGIEDEDLIDALLTL